MTTLSVVIPAYNEEDGIAAIVERVLAIGPALATVGVDGLECIVVDDGSSDRTPEIVRGYSPEATLICQANRGYGGALKTGFSMARGELLAFLDADSTYPPEYFPQMCKVALDGADVVIGSRMAGTSSEMPLVRRIGNTIFATLLSVVAGVRISDSASGQRVLRREVLPQLYPLPDTLDFTPAMSTRALHENLKMVEVPIPYKERSGRSKLSVVRDGLRFFKSIVWTALTYNPVRIFGGLGIALLLAGIVVGGLPLLAHLLGMQASWPFPRLFGALVLVVAGIMLYTTGTSFSYIVKLFHKRHIRQGLFGPRGNGRRSRAALLVDGSPGGGGGHRRLSGGGDLRSDKPGYGGLVVRAGGQRAAGADGRTAGGRLGAGARAVRAERARWAGGAGPHAGGSAEQRSAARRAPILCRSIATGTISSAT